MSNFLTEDELKKLGLKSFGNGVLIGRHVVLYSPEKLTIGDHVRIDDFTIISGKVTMGNYIHVSQFCGIYGGDDGIVMEDFSGLSSKCSIYAVSDDYTGLSMTNPMIPAEYKPTSISKEVHIGRHAIVGCNSVVLPGVDVPEGAAVGSLSLVTRSLEPWSINTGIPARKKSDRHRNILELETMFLKSIDEKKIVDNSCDKDAVDDSRNSKLKVGQTASFSKTISEADIYGFAGIVGDFNSAHINQIEAQKGLFKDRVAHGMLVGSLISTVLGTKLPGEGTVYLEQNMKFRKPVYIGDTVTAVVKVKEVINPSKGIYRLETIVKNQDDVAVIEGESVVLYSQSK